MKQLIWIIGFSFLFSTCQNTPIREAKTSFYYWKTTFQLNDFEQEALASLSTSNLYVRFFDLDWNPSLKEITPVASLVTNQAVQIPFEIIPVIFITNRSFKNCTTNDLDPLIDKLIAKVEKGYLAFPNHKIHELQIDCDWTEQTREIYFLFLNKLKTKLKAQSISLSTTIRLHQIKFFNRTGVPPADRGMLMFYNVDKVEDLATNNSILDLEQAKKYLFNFDEYPLTLNVALPIFKWGVLFRNGEMIKLINGLESAQLHDESRFLKTNKNRYEVIKSTYLDAYYLYQGDEIRLEGIDKNLLSKAATLLNPYLENPSLEVTYYHLDSVLIKNFQIEELDSITKLFSNN